MYCFQMTERIGARGEMSMEDSLLSEWWKNSGDYFASDLKLGDVDVNGNPYKWEGQENF